MFFFYFLFFSSPLKMIRNHTTSVSERCFASPRSSLAWNGQGTSSRRRRWLIDFLIEPVHRAITQVLFLLLFSPRFLSICFQLSCFEYESSSLTIQKIYLLINPSFISILFIIYKLDFIFSKNFNDHFGLL